MGQLRHLFLYLRFREFSMIPAKIFIANLKLCEKFKRVPGCVVECGVWRGGMIGAIAKMLGRDRWYYLFYSFEGLPPAREIDGKAAQAWQADRDHPHYWDNCRAEMSFAEESMRLSGARHYRLVKGWFAETLPGFKPQMPIAVLRMDGDWYDSTTQILNDLYHLVEKGGLILIDDYLVWDGCSRAVHDFLSKNSLPDKIRQTPEGVVYIIKGS